MKSSKLIPVHAVKDKLLYLTEIQLSSEELSVLYSVLQDYVDAHAGTSSGVEYEAELAWKINILLGLMKLNDS